MAISIVQALTKAEANNTASLQSVAFGSPPTSGNTILVFVGWHKASGTPSMSSVTDTQSNGYVFDVNGLINTAPGCIGCGIARSSVITGGSSFKITVNMTGTVILTYGAIEVSGLSSSPFDKTNTNGSTTTTTTPTTGATGTLSQANELLCIVTAQSNFSITYTEPTVPGTFTSQVQENGASFGNMDGATLIVASNATANPQWTTTTSPFFAAIATYMQAAAASPPAAAQITMARMLDDFYLDDLPSGTRRW